MSTVHSVAPPSETVLKKFNDVATFLLTKGADEEDEYAREAQRLYLFSTSHPVTTTTRTTFLSEGGLPEISSTIASTTTTVQPTLTQYANVRVKFIHLFVHSVIYSCLLP